MKKDDKVYIGHMIDLADRIIDMTSKIDREEYDKSEYIRLACLHL